MATKQKTSNTFQTGTPSNAANTMPGMGNNNDSGGGGVVNKEVGDRQSKPSSTMAEDSPGIFDLFYEEFLTNVMKDTELSERIPNEFVQLQSDFERVEYLLHLSPSIRNFDIKSKFGTKSLDRSNKYREEGNKLFQADQTMQSILFYNKSIAYAPHPNIKFYNNPPTRVEKVTSVQFSDEVLPPDLQEVNKANRSMKKKSEPRKPSSPYESLSYCYANRSAALRKLSQYEECLLDVARAAKFGYPREIIFKLWERKGKCYIGLKRYEQAAKCLRQAIQCLKESYLTDNQKALKSHELQALLKEWQNTKIVMQMADGTTQSIGGNPDEAEKKKEPKMGKTGQFVLIKEPEFNPNDKKLSMVKAELAQQQAQQKAALQPQPNSLPPRHDRLNRQPSGRQRKISNASGSGMSPTPPMTPTGEQPDTNLEGYANFPSNPMNRNPSSSFSTPTTPTFLGPGVPNLQRTPSQLSISQISHTGVIKLDDIEVPELSYGQNPKMLSASSGIDVRFSPDKGRYFAATHDLQPGIVIINSKHVLWKFFFVCTH
jgi:tetratricopeptide (TPR) repeat protein